MKILIVQLRQLGDIMLTTPVIRALKEHYPQAEVSFLSHPMGKLVLVDNPLLHEHLVMPTSGLMAQVRFLKTLKQKKFDLVFDFMGNPRSALMTLCTMAPTRVGFRSPRAWAYNVVVPRESGEDYIVKEKFRMLASQGVVASDERLMFAWNESHLKPAELFMEQERDFKDSVARIALSPTHRRENRRWPAAHWAQLADDLVRERQASVIWLWGPGEEDEVRTIQKMCVQRTCMAPKTTFRELAALTAQCELFIGNSNGPSHVAVAVNTPSIQLHGPTDAPSWCPMTARHVATSAERMENISVEEVSQLATRLWPIVCASTSTRGMIHSDADVWKLRPVL